MEIHHWLRLTNGSAQSRYSLSPSQEMVIGRSPDCKILIDSSEYGGVSRRHAAVKPATGTSTAWQICDLGSANGTYINGQRLQGCQTLAVGDRIMLGQNGPQFILEQQSQVSPAAQPAPQPASDLSVSQLLPVISARQDLLKKGYLIPGIFTVLVVVSLFATIGNPNPNVFNYLLALYLGGGAFFFIYRLCGQRKPWFVILFAILFTMIALLDAPSPPFPEGFPGPILFVFALLYRYGFIGLILIPLGLALLVVALIKVTKGRANHAAGWGLSALSFMGVGGWVLGSGNYVQRNLEDPTSGFINQFISHFFGAGLMEELLKALPILALFWFGSLLRSPNRERFGVWEPLDGIVLGAASALGFTLVETVGQYVPNIMAQAAQEFGADAGKIYAIQLLIPRILGSVAGHMAYSGYFGYFIGLSILRSKQRFQILATGYLSASLLHAFWNATPSLASSLGALVGNVIQMGVGVASYVFLTAAILKARKLSPNRAKNFATQMAPPP